MTATITRTVLPPEHSHLDELATKLDHLDAAPVLHGPDGDEIALPAEVFEVLRGVVHAMARSQAVTFTLVPQRLTTQQAAELLGVSRPTLIKLLEDGQIDYEQPNRHRRVLLASLLAYRERRASERRVALDEMHRIAEEAGMYEATLDHNPLVKDE